MNCHTIAGTDAKGKFGPDLTHLMSRADYRGGRCCQDTGKLADSGFRDPDAIKPGVLMPAMQMSEEEVDAVTAYLMTLS